VLETRDDGSTLLADRSENGIDVLLDCIDVKEALKKLESNDRELIYFIYESGLNYEEISKITGIPTGTIKSRMHGIKAKLRKYLE
jgi:RNA polymerase sigma-70 factor (ECF subfamily)